MNLGRESETVEFKKSKAELKEGISSIAAILNKHGKGELFFGVKNNGDVCGLQVSDATLREIGQTIDQSIEPRVHPIVEKLSDDNGRDYIRVSFEGKEAPYACKGVFRLRVSDSDVLMSVSEVKRMSVQDHYSKMPWDEQPSDFSIEDVRESVLLSYLERGRETGRISFDYAGIYDALARLELLHGEQLTNAAAVLFCQPKYVMLKMAVFATEARVNILDMHQEREDLFKMAQMAEDYVMRNLKWRYIIDGSMQRDEVPEIPAVAIREALINAFCHRDYASDLAVQVDIFGDKVEIFSPGSFPLEVTPQQLLEDGVFPFSKSPNRLIAQTLYRSKDIESYGTGLPRIQKTCSRAGIEFEYLTGGQGTVVRFIRPSWHAQKSDVTTEPMMAQRQPLSVVERETLAIALAQSDGRVTAQKLMREARVSRRTANATLAKLVKQGKLVPHATNQNDPNKFYTAQ